MENTSCPKKHLNSMDFYVFVEKDKEEFEFRRDDEHRCKSGGADALSSKCKAE